MINVNTKTNEVDAEISGTCPLIKKMHAPRNAYIRIVQLIQRNKLVLTTYTLEVIRGIQINWG